MLDQWPLLAGLCRSTVAQGSPQCAAAARLCSRATRPALCGRATRRAGCAAATSAQRPRGARAAEAARPRFAAQDPARRLSNPPTSHSGKPRWATQSVPRQSLPCLRNRESYRAPIDVCRRYCRGGRSLTALSGGDGPMVEFCPMASDNPRQRYYDYHPPGVFYGDAGPNGFSASGFVAASPLPSYGSAGYGYIGSPYAAPSVAVPVAPRPLCGVYRYWRDGICVDRRGY